MSAAPSERIVSVIRRPVEHLPTNDQEVYLVFTEHSICEFHPNLPVSMQWGYYAIPTEDTSI